jgi:hypothetical protein
MEEETDWSQISRSDQRSYIEIETLRRKNATEFLNALQEVWGESVVDRSTVSRWASRLHEGQVSIQDDPRSGHPVTSTDDTSMVIVSTLLEEDRRKSCEENAYEAKHVNRLCFQNRDSNIAEEKSRCKVGSASAERRTESSSLECRRTTAALRGRR